MHFAFLHLVHIAEVDQKFIRLVERHSHVTKVLHVFGQLIEDQGLVLCCLLVKLLLLALHQALKFSVKFSKSFVKNSPRRFHNALSTNVLFLLLTLLRSSKVGSASPSLHPECIFVHFIFECRLNALSPSTCILPYPMVHQVEGDALLPPIVLIKQVL